MGSQARRLSAASCNRKASKTAMISRKFSKDFKANTLRIRWRKEILFPACFQVLRMKSTLRDSNLHNAEDCVWLADKREYFFRSTAKGILLEHYGIGRFEKLLDARRRLASYKSGEHACSCITLSLFTYLISVAIFFANSYIAVSSLSL